MSKLTFPITEILSTGNLCSLYDDLLKYYSGLTEINTDNTKVLQNGFAQLSKTQLNDIVANGGKVEEHLMALRVPASFMNEDVLVDLPNRMNLITGLVKKFQDWFDSTAEIWRSDDNLEYIFFTKPHGNSKTEYLTGEQIRNIWASDNVNIDILTTAQATDEIASGWIKL
jgi:hypothetical protein